MNVERKEYPDICPCAEPTATALKLTDSALPKLTTEVNFAVGKLVPMPTLPLAT
jgi:hypothetical protein